MKMARPSERDFDTVIQFLQGFEMHLEQGVHPEEDGGDEVLDDDQFMDWVHEKWDRVSAAYWRVLYAGKTAIDNCCDPAADVLEFRPDIAAARQGRGHIQPVRHRRGAVEENRGVGVTDPLQ